ncbi:MAG: hypothetical protein GXY68_03910 [Chloroflexi bacterium]|jgi:hypothetical protein|nr:hypothetical protein [Chloroflexota bacterium]
MPLSLFRTGCHLSAGEPIEALGWRITPMARALVWRGRGGLVRLRPCAVHTQRPGERALVPVPDATLQWQLGAFIAGLLTALLLTRIGRTRACR